MRGQALVAASAMAAVLLAAPQAAAQQYPSYHDAHVAQQNYCAQRANNNTALGAAIGGIAGAVLGSQVAARGHRTDGSILGGVVGAVAGGMIGRSNAQRQCATQPQGAYDPYYGQPQQQYGHDQYRNDGYYNDDELYGGPYQESGYYGASDPYRGDCRMGEVITRDPYGREYRDNVMMCRGRDGQWRPQG
jgi:hypothetical protein